MVSQNVYVAKDSLVIQMVSLDAVMSMNVPIILVVRVPFVAMSQEHSVASALRALQEILPAKAVRLLNPLDVGLHSLVQQENNV